MGAWTIQRPGTELPALRWESSSSTPNSQATARSTLRLSNTLSGTPSKSATRDSELTSSRTLESHLRSKSEALLIVLQPSSNSLLPSTDSTTSRLTSLPLNAGLLTPTTNDEIDMPSEGLP